MINAASGLYASNAMALQHAVEHSEKGLAKCAAAKDAYLHRIEEALALLKVCAKGPQASVPCQGRPLLLTRCSRGCAGLRVKAGIVTSFAAAMGSILRMPACQSTLPCW